MKVVIRTKTPYETIRDVYDVTSDRDWRRIRRIIRERSKWYNVTIYIKYS